jgi:hypothetical protein
MSFYRRRQTKNLLMELKRFTKDYNNIKTKDMRRKIAGKVVEENRYCF